MHLDFHHIQGRDKGKTGFVLGLGPSLRNHLSTLRSIDKDKDHFKIVSCNNIDRLTDINFDYWMLAQPADINSPFNIQNAANRYNCHPRATLLYTDCLDLTDRNLVQQLLQNMDYIGYDQRHFKGMPCTWSNGIGGRHICCEHIIAERKCIQEVLQEVTKTNYHYSPGDTVGVHMLALAVITGMNPIYITGIDLDYTDGYVKNDLPDSQERIGMGMSSINNSPAMVENIIRDFTLIRDAAKNIGVEIYCMDEGLKISEIFPYRKFTGDVACPTLDAYAEKPQELFDGGTVQEAPTLQLHSPALSMPAANITDLLAKAERKFKPNDEYDWSGYTKEYSNQLQEIINDDKMDLFIDKKFTLVFEHDNQVSGKIISLNFENNLHPNWKEIYTNAYCKNVKSIYEVGFGGGYHIRNLHLMLPFTEIAGCDLLESQRKFSDTLSGLPEDVAKNLKVMDFTTDFEVERQYEFVFSQAVIMHMSTDHAMAALKNMGRISSKYIMLVEGIKNHDGWYDMVKEALPDWKFEVTNNYINYGILLTKKSAAPDTDLGGCGNDQSVYNNQPQSAVKFSAETKYWFQGESLSASEIIKRINEAEVKNGNGEYVLYNQLENVNVTSTSSITSPVDDKTRAELLGGQTGKDPKYTDETDVRKTVTEFEYDKPLSGKIVNKPILVFTEIIDCAEVGKVAIESFHKHHDHKLVIFATKKDIEELGDVATHKNNKFMDMTDNTELLELYKKGHAGTAWIFAKVFSGEMFPDAEYIVHFDSDVFFKKQSLSAITEAFQYGYDIVGSRRCYENNPAGIPVFKGTPDTVSTYFFGMKRSMMPTGYSFEDLQKMFSGHNLGLDHEVFDFGDCITFHALKKGAKVHYLSPIIFGGQDEKGTKPTTSLNESNLHIDSGTHLMHFGGAGSGCVYYNHPDGKNKSYGDWALIRYALFCDIFRLKIPDANIPGTTEINTDGRWVSGPYNAEILVKIKNDLNS